MTNLDEAFRVLKRSATPEERAALDALRRELAGIRARVRKLEQLMLKAAPKAP